MYTLYVVPGSHACRSALLMLEHKQVPTGGSTWSPCLHQPSDRALPGGAGTPSRRKVSTVAGYESYLRVHIAPFFGEKPIARITKDDVDEFVSSASRAARQSKHPQLRRLPARLT
jgi:Phage integrase, N-terminal SAM-like domain